MERMNNIGIITFHTPDNYGAVYQAYALQHYIENTFNTNVEIINFCTERHIRAYSIFRRKSNSSIKNIALQLITMFKYKELHDKQKKFQEYRNKFLHLSSKRYSSEDELLNDIEPYDIYITGSDQVFNPNNEFIRAYYMDFPKKNSKKIAYAPSFGISNFTEKVSAKILPFLVDFDSLSCREKDGSEYLSSLINKEVPVVVDPVFLLDKNNWEKIAKEPKEKERYIFIYDLCGGEKLISLAHKIKEKTGFKIICATGNIRKRYKYCISKYNVGPTELLGYINNAEYVVTDSFHGTSLSLILNTKVISFIALKHASARLISIMEQLGLTNQIVQDVDSFKFEGIKFNEYQSQLENMISNSKEYLFNSIK